MAQTLKNAGVDFKADVFKIDDRAKFEAEFKEIPGQGSGKSLNYFYMLAGSDDHVALNNMVLRFIADAIGREPTDEGYELIVVACKELKQQYRDLTLRKLDHSIWKFQRDQ